MLIIKPAAGWILLILSPCTYISVRKKTWLPPVLVMATVTLRVEISPGKTVGGNTATSPSVQPFKTQIKERELEANRGLRCVKLGKNALLWLLESYKVNLLWVFFLTLFFQWKSPTSHFLAWNSIRCYRYSTLEKKLIPVEKEYQDCAYYFDLEHV